MAISDDGLDKSDDLFFRSTFETMVLHDLSKLLVVGQVPSLLIFVMPLRSCATAGITGELLYAIKALMNVDPVAQAFSVIQLTDVSIKKENVWSGDSCLANSY